MAIADQTATQNPPAFHVHEYAAATDTVDDLNAWAISLFSPQYDDSHPAFQVAPDNTLHYFDGVGFAGVAITDGWYIVFDSHGGILIMAASDFTSHYTVSS